LAAAALLEEAASGRLPDWAVARPSRRRHMERVAALLGDWATRLGLEPAERRRWLAAGWLHDALRDAPADALREDAGSAFAGLPGGLLHGPATATRLAREGVGDDGLLDAIRYHTLGHAELDPVGRALFLADYLEPGRPFRPGWRASLRARMPTSFDAVLVEVLRARIEQLIRYGMPVRPETVGFWNALARERRA
jgi:HD superfamily phosphohydrolase YqeK